MSNRPFVARDAYRVAAIVEKRDMNTVLGERHAVTAAQRLVEQCKKRGIDPEGLRQAMRGFVGAQATGTAGKGRYALHCVNK